MKDFVLEKHGQGSTVHVVLRGELDLATSKLLEEQVIQIAEASAERIVVDLRDLTFMDSTGLCAILRADARARESGCTLVVVRGPEAVDRVFRITKTDDVLAMAPRPEPLLDRPLVARRDPAGERRYASVESGSARAWSASRPGGRAGPGSSSAP